MQIYNTTTHKKETFKPNDPEHIKLYACGPTVYDYFHIGNARAFIVFDTLRRVLKKKYPKVTYVQNVTDVDDKIINRANEEKRSAHDVAVEYTKAFFEDISALGCLAADHAPLATEHMQEIINLIKVMIEKEHAYEIDGDVFFAVRSFGNYGCISGKKIDDLESGARININERKKDPLDFALWKAAKPGDPSWPSPWGEGRPGWHIECSAMSMKYLGDNFDIHGGGEDLVFPHHENENAQSESVSGKPLANYWMHNGYLKIDGEKMSKSLGNFKVVRDILKQYPYQTLRLFMLSAHYRSPLDFNQENMEAANNGYQELNNTVHRLSEILRQPVGEDEKKDAGAEELINITNELEKKFDDNLNDDLNTAGAIGQIYTLANKIKQLLAGRPEKSFVLFNALKISKKKILDMLELLGVDPDIQLAPDEILEMIARRSSARMAKDWAESDRLRDEIHRKGFLLEDTNFGSLAIKR